MKVIDKVEWLLRNSQTLRDSDMQLMLAYWETQGFILSQNQRKTFLDKCTTAETITRARRALKDKYPASDEVDKKRFELYTKYKIDKHYEVVED